MSGVRLTPEERMLRAVTEKAWQQQVVEILEWHGWTTYHTFDSRRSDPGFPDLVAIRARDGDHLVAELKRQTGVMTSDQLRWHALFLAAGVDAYVWRPADVDKVITRARWPNCLEM